MLSLPAPRSLNLIGFITCATLIITALYFEHAMGLEPCPLCMAQRIMLVAAGLAFLAAFIHQASGLAHRIYASLSALFCVAGAGLASRQLWLQSLPADQVPACGPSLDYMIEVLPLMEVLSVMIRGSGDCAEVAWTFLGLSIPGWTLIAFVGLAVLSLIIWVRRPIT